MANESFIRPEDLWSTVGLRAEQTVVHLGCGAGFYLIPAARIVGKNGKVIGLDILPDMLAEAQSRAEREEVADIVQTKRANLENPQGSGLEENIADWVLVANILHQASLNMILKEAMRIVAHNGHVLIVEWDTIASPFGPPADQRISQEEVRAAAIAAGFSVEKEFRPSQYHYALVLKK